VTKQRKKLLAENKSCKGFKGGGEEKFNPESGKEGDLVENGRAGKLNRTREGTWNRSKTKVFVWAKRGAAKKKGGTGGGLG